VVSHRLLTLEGDPNDGSALDMWAHKVTLQVNGGGSVVPVGVKRTYASFPSTGTVRRWRLITDAVSSTQVRVLKASTGQFPTFHECSGVTHRPTVTAGRLAESEDLTGWDRQVEQGDVFDFEVLSNTAASHIIVELWIA
jgi:hypothetical protein